MPKKPTLEPLDLGKETIGERIVQLRKTRGYTQKSLAEKLGISRASLWSYESGRLRLYDELLARLAVIFDVSIDYIVGLKKSHKNIKNPKN